ncbi:MAG: hypothetical protein QOE61_977 [Micromonosporaceae bacterium]|jgi:hypothetical protein|nr:hypothetical protein [Micromonosporaceae bacterium]
MNEGFWIDPDQVRSSAPAFSQLGDRLGEIFSSLRGKLETEGRCWGSDDYGKAFEKSYNEPKNNAYHFFPQLTKGLHDIGKGLVETADTADRGESASHQKFKT